jgi:hypothetical protein
VHASFNWYYEDRAIMVVERAPASVYQFDNQSRPVPICFQMIKWHLDDSACLRSRYLAGCEPRPPGRGRPKPNDDYVIWVFQNMYGHIFFDPGSQNFYRLKMEPEPLHVEEVKKLLHQTLVAIRDCSVAPKWLANVSTGPRHLAQLVTMLKVGVVRPAGRMRRLIPPSDPAGEEAETFDLFMETCWQREQGASVTVAEAYDAYQAFCLSRSAPQYTEYQFNRRLSKAVRRTYAIGQNHYTVRAGKPNRGFRHIRIKAMGQHLSENPDSVDTVPSDLENGQDGTNLPKSGAPQNPVIAVPGPSTAICEEAGQTLTPNCL